MISVLSKFRRPTVFEFGEPSREFGLSETRRRRIVSQFSAKSTSTASCGGANANRPKLRGRKIAGRTYGCPTIRVPERHDTRRRAYRSDTGRPGAISKINQGANMATTKAKKMTFRQRLRAQSDDRLERMISAMNGAAIRVCEEANTEINPADVMRMCYPGQTKSLRTRLIGELSNEVETALEKIYNKQMDLLAEDSDGE